jgi:hypothetical protein
MDLLKGDREDEGVIGFGVGGGRGDGECVGPEGPGNGFGCAELLNLGNGMVEQGGARAEGFEDNGSGRQA